MVSLEKEVVPKFYNCQFLAPIFQILNKTMPISSVFQGKNVLSVITLPTLTGPYGTDLKCFTD